jgi:hypothetical protein
MQGLESSKIAESEYEMAYVPLSVEEQEALRQRRKETRERDKVAHKEAKRVNPDADKSTFVDVATH